MKRVLLLGLAAVVSCIEETVLDLAVLPFGVDYSSDETRAHWAREPVVPSARIFLSLRVMVGSAFERLLDSSPHLSPERDLFVDLTVKSFETGAALATMNAQPLSSGEERGK